MSVEQVLISTQLQDGVPTPTGKLLVQTLHGLVMTGVGVDRLLCCALLDLPSADLLYSGPRMSVEQFMLMTLLQDGVPTPAGKLSVGTVRCLSFACVLFLFVRAIVERIGKAQCDCKEDTLKEEIREVTRIDFLAPGVFL